MNNSSCLRNSPVCCNCPPRKCGKGKDDGLGTRIQKGLAADYCSNNRRKTADQPNSKYKPRTSNVCVVGCQLNNMPKPMNREEQVRGKIVQESRTGRRSTERTADVKPGMLQRKNVTVCDRQNEIRKELRDLHDRQSRIVDGIEHQKRTLLDELERISSGRRAPEIASEDLPLRRRAPSSVPESPDADRCECGCTN